MRLSKKVSIFCFLFAICFLFIFQHLVSYGKHQKSSVVPGELPYEIFPAETIRVLPEIQYRKKQKPKVAILIDDIGYNVQMAIKFKELPVPISFSVLPGSPFGEKIAFIFHNEGREILLHQPMEPHEYPRVNPGPGTLFVAMERDAIFSVLSGNFSKFPFAIGMNNHMGSKFTENKRCMFQVFSFLKKNHLYFIDSVTSSKSVCGLVGKLTNLPMTKRDIFLDAIPKPTFISKQLDQLIRTAIQNGEALGIGHPYPETLRQLSEKLPNLMEVCDVISCSELIHSGIKNR